MLQLVLQISFLLFVSAINLNPGRTTASPGWKRIGNHSWFPTPLIATGNEMPLLVGKYGAYTPHPTQKYTVFGSLDGTGVEKVTDVSGVTHYYVYVNHEYSTQHQVQLPGSSQILFGGRISLYAFTEDFQIIGGKELVSEKRSGSTGETLNIPFGGLCAAMFVETGFVGGPVFLTSEEGDGAFNSYAVTVRDGIATRIEGCGSLHHENTVASSSYLPLKNHPSKKTVLLTSDDSISAEIFMYVGSQTASDPNGFANGELYVLRVENFAHEEMALETEYTGSWTKIPHELAYAVGEDAFHALDAWVNEENRSTNFRKIEDINEDPKNPDTFYFAATGGPYTVNTSLNISHSDCALGSRIPGGCDNPFGKIYRISISKTNPTDPPKIELVLEGSPEHGAGYDNVCVTRDRKILILEDATPISLTQVMQPKHRYVQMHSFDLQTSEVFPLFEVDYATLQPNDAPYAQHMSHSGIVEFGDEEDPMYMIALQGPAYNVVGDHLQGLRIFSGQLAVISKREPHSITSNNQLVSFGQIQSRLAPLPPAVSPPVPAKSEPTGLLIGLILGWVLFAIAGGIAIFLSVHRRFSQM